MGGVYQSRLEAVIARLEPRLLCRDCGRKRCKRKKLLLGPRRQGSDLERRSGRLPLQEERLLQFGGDQNLFARAGQGRDQDLADETSRGLLGGPDLHPSPDLGRSLDPDRDLDRDPDLHLVGGAGLARRSNANPNQSVAANRSLAAAVVVAAAAAAVLADCALIFSL